MALTKLFDLATPEAISDAVEIVEAIRPSIDATVAWGMQAEAKSLEVAADAALAALSKTAAETARVAAETAAASVPTEEELSATIAASLGALAVPLESAMEMQPMVAQGHSYIAQQNQTTDTRAHERVASRLRMGAISNRGESGAHIRLVAMSALAGTFRWAPRTKALAWLMCTINNVQLHGDLAAGVREYAWAWDALLSRITCNAAIPVNRREWVFTSGWAAEAVAGVTDNTATGGVRYWADDINDYFEFAYSDTGTGVDVVLVAKSTAGGTITFTEGGTALGSVSLANPALGDCPVVHKIRGRGVGTHTIRGTITAAGRVDVDSINIPALAPVPGVVLGEGLVNRTPTVGSTPYAALLTARKAQLAAIVSAYPSFVFCNIDAAPNPAGQAWNMATMLREDNTHPNDYGCAFIADRGIEALRGLPFTRGLNILDAGEAFYVSPAGPAIPAGGFTGSGLPLPGEFYDVLDRADAAIPGSLTTGQAWTVYGTATWGPLSGAMVTKSGGVSWIGMDAAAADGTLRAIMGPRGVADAYGGPVFRGVDASNYWQIAYRTVGGVSCYNITSRTSGTPGEVAWTSTQATPGDLIEVSLSGTSIRLYVNGVLQTLNLIAGGAATVYTSATRQTATKHGWAANFGSNATRAGFSSWAFDV